MTTEKDCLGLSWVDNPATNKGAHTLLIEDLFSQADRSQAKTVEDAKEGCCPWP
jgi:hypothetical protein